jgi:AraC family transcriptional regulator of adaptative response / DNA-3-methyladenine glycosylase II
VKVYAGRKLGGEAMASLHGAALRVLGLSLDVSQFETRHAAFIAPRRGLRLPLLPTGFDALCWGIIGQQINIKFASALRREIVELAGEKVGDMRAHPTPERVADIGIPTLAARRYSRSKAQYLIDAAAAVAEGKLDIENLGEGSAIAAEKALTSQRVSAPGRRAMCCCAAASPMQRRLVTARWRRRCSVCTSCPNGPMRTKPRG